MEDQKQDPNVVITALLSSNKNDVRQLTDLLENRKGNPIDGDINMTQLSGGRFLVVYRRAVIVPADEIKKAIGHDFDL